MHADESVHPYTGSGSMGQSEALQAEDPSQQLTEAPGPPHSPHSSVTAEPPQTPKQSVVEMQEPSSIVAEAS